MPNEEEMARLTRELEQNNAHLRRVIALLLELLGRRPQPDGEDDD